MVKAAAPPRSRDIWLVVLMLSLTLIGALQGKAGDDPSDSLPNQVLWGGAYLIAGLRLIAMRKQLAVFLAGSASLLAFIALALVSTFWSVDPAVTLKNSLELAGTTAVGAFIVARFRFAEFLNIQMLFFGGSAVLSLVLIFLSPGRGRMFWGSGPWDGLYEEKNALGAAMAMAILAFGTYLLQRKAPRRPLAAAGLALCALLLAGSNSATALIALVTVLAIGAIALACVSPLYGRASLIVVLIGGAFLVAALSLTGFDPNQLAALFGRSETLTGRADFWPYLSNAVNARPFFGYGYGAFFRSPIARDFLSYYVVEAGGWSPYHAHNSFLQACLDTGYVGLTVLIALTLASLLRAARFFLRVKSVASLWTFLLIAYLVLGSYTETYLGSFNTLEWIFFTAAFLYPIRTDAVDSESSVQSKRSAKLQSEPTVPVYRARSGRS